MLETARVAAAMRGMRSFGKYGSLGFELLASIAVGYYLGLWADRKLGTRWLALVGFLVGCYAGFRVLYRAAKQMTRDIERDERIERGEDPWAKPEDEQTPVEGEGERGREEDR